MSESISSSLPSVLRRRRWSAIATFVSVICGSLAYLIVTPRQYETSARLMLDEKRVSISELGRDLTQLPSGGPSDPSPIATQAELVKSQRVLNRALDQVFPQGTGSLSRGALTTEKLSQGLKVKTVPATNILELSYRDQDPTLAAKLLNAVSQALVEESGEAIRSEARSVRIFLEAEIPNRRTELEQAEAAENQYRQTSGVISLADQTKSLVDSLATLENEERTLSAQLQQAKARDSSLSKITHVGTLRSAYAAARIGQNEELKNLRAKLADLEAKVIYSRAHLRDDNPALLTLLEQRDATRALYTQQLSRVLERKQAYSPALTASDELSQNLLTKLIVGETERLALENQLRVVQTQRANLQARLAQLPIKQQPLAALTRRREEAEVALKLLQGKLEEARIAEAQLVGNIRVIERAQLPSVSTWPKRSVVLVVANVAGLILAVGVVLLLEKMDNTLRDATEVKKLVKLPVLGVLPVLPTNSLLLENAELFLENSGLVEPYRTLLRTIEFRSIKGLRVVVVSSTVSGEGKSVVVSHLAAVSAMLFRRTLIIDADWRCPSQHKLFNLAAKPGLTDVIDEYVTLTQAAQQTSIKHLSVLTTGEQRLHSSQFLESSRMRTLLAEAAGDYDLVIVDTAPVTSCVDATSLSYDSGGLLLVARPNLTSRDTLVQAVSELTDNDVNILGVAVNGMTTETKKYDQYPVQSYQPPVKQLKRYDL